MVLSVSFRRRLGDIEVHFSEEVPSQPGSPIFPRIFQGKCSTSTCLQVASYLERPVCMKGFEIRKQLRDSSYAICSRSTVPSNSSGVIYPKPASNLENFQSKLITKKKENQ